MKAKTKALEKAKKTEKICKHCGKPLKDCKCYK